MIHSARHSAAALTVDDLGGPRRLPLVGNLPEFLRGGVSHEVLHRWADEYGLTYRFFLGRHKMVVSADPAIVDTILRRRPDDFRRVKAASLIMDEIASANVFTAEGDRWRRLRKMATQSLNAAYLRQYFSTITTATERLLRLWERAATAGDQVDVMSVMTRYTLDVTTGLAMGYDLNSLENTGAGLHSRMRMLFPAFARRINAPFPYWRYVKLPRDRRLDATVREIEAAVRERFAAARHRMATGAAPTNFLEALVRPLDNEPSITDDEVFGNVLIMLLAGEDTTSASAAWALHYMAENPEVHRRVREEAESVLGDRVIPNDPSMVGKLKYTESVIHEVLRMRPVAPYQAMQPRREMSVTGRSGGLLLRRGQPVFVLMSYGARRDTARFPDPEVFRPQRWLEDGLPPESLPFAPFGNGPRFCPGRNLALLEATIVAAVLGRAFDLAPDRSAGPVRERMSFAAFPVNLFLRPSCR